MGARRRRSRGERGAPRLRSRRERARDERRGQVSDAGPGHLVERPLAPARDQRGTHAQQTAASRVADRAGRMADGGGVAANGSRPLVSRGSRSGRGDVLDRASVVWRRCRARGRNDRRHDGRGVRDGALGGAGHDALARHRGRHGRVRGGRIRWPPGRVVRLLWACGGRVLGEGARRADAARRRGRLPVGSLRLARGGTHASRDGHRDSRGAGRALVAAGSPCPAISVAAWAVVASTLMVGEMYVTARDNRGTQLRTIARALEQVSAPMFALEAPELVFSFYLRLSIPAVSSMTELRGVDPPVYVIARDPLAPEAFDPVAQGLVKGRRFVLWLKH